MKIAGCEYFGLSVVNYDWTCVLLSVIQLQFPIAIVLHFLVIIFDVFLSCCFLWTEKNAETIENKNNRQMEMS